MKKLLLFTLFCFPLLTFSQSGCTDSTACNYDPLANFDDGSCTYPITSTTSITTCDTSYTWPLNGQTYTTSGTYTNSISGGSSPTLTATYNTSGNAQSVSVNAVKVGELPPEIE